MGFSGKSAVVFVCGWVALVAPPAFSGQQGAMNTLASFARFKSTPAEYINKTTVVFEFQLEAGGVDAECKLDSGAYLGCSSPVSRRSLAEGSHSFCLRGIAADGTKDETPACYNWTVDLTPPELSLSKPTEGSGVSTAKPVIEGTTSEPSCTVQVTLDEKSVGSTVSGADGKWSFTVPTELSNGEHKVSATVADRAGNLGKSSVSASFRVSTDLPTTAIVERPPQTSGSPHAVFEFASPSGATAFECQLDSAADFSPCDEVWLVKRLAQGAHKLRVRAKDIAGNVDPAPLEHQWTVSQGAGVLPCSTRDEAAASGCASSGSQPTLALCLLSSVLMLAARRRRV